MSGPTKPRARGQEWLVRVDMPLAGVTGHVASMSRRTMRYQKVHPETGAPNAGARRFKRQAAAIAWANKLAGGWPEPTHKFTVEPADALPPAPRKCYVRDPSTPANVSPYTDALGQVLAMVRPKLTESAIMGEITLDGACMVAGGLITHAASLCESIAETANKESTINANAARAAIDQLSQLRKDFAALDQKYEKLDDEACTLREFKEDHENSPSHETPAAALASFIATEWLASADGTRPAPYSYSGQGRGRADLAELIDCLNRCLPPYFGRLSLDGQ